MIQGALLRPILASLYDIPETRIDVAPPLDSNRYDFVLVLPQDVTRETMIRLMRERIEKQFHVTREVTPMDVDVLTAPHGIRAQPAEGEGFGFGFGSMGFVDDVRHGATNMLGSFQLADIMNLHMVPSEVAPSPEADLRAMRRALLRASHGSVRGGIGIHSVDDSLTMEELCQLLESALDRPVVDETHLTDRYALKVHAEVVSTRDFMRVLCDKLGVVVTGERRDVQVLTARQR